MSKALPNQQFVQIYTELLSSAECSGPGSGSVDRVIGLGIKGLLVQDSLQADLLCCVLEQDTKGILSTA